MDNTLIKRDPAFTNHLNIGADTVKKALTHMVDENKCTQDQHDLIWWYFNYAKEQGFTLQTCAEEIGYADATTPFRVFQGKYEANLKNFCSKVSAFKKIADERGDLKKTFFVETTCSKKVFQICHAARISQTVAWIFGDSQIGKTAALKEYTRKNNHGQTIYVRLPASAGVQLVMKSIARACHVNPETSLDNIRRRVLSAIDHNMLLIIDELHQVFTSYHSSSQIKVMELLREIYDETQCGLVLCGTHVLKKEVEEGKLTLVLEQLRRRGTLRLELPDRPGKKDIQAIANRFDLPAPTEREIKDIREMVSTSGLGMYVKFLQAGYNLAHKADQTMTWDHFIEAFIIIQRASKPTKSDREDML